MVYVCLFAGSCGNPDAKRLYDDLLSNYNKLVRPVTNVSDPVVVKIKLKLSQLIDVVSKIIFKNYAGIFYKYTNCCSRQIGGNIIKV